MKKYILADLDNTLIDFGECARHGMMDGFKKYGLPYEDSFFDVFTTENNKLWKTLETGAIEKSYIRENRWNIIFEKLGIDFDGRFFEKYFEDAIANGAYPVEGAYDLLEYLGKKYDVFIVTNGFRSVQENRIRLGGFDKYFKDIFISEDAGYPKPAKEFFDYCFEKMGYPEVSEYILIGDSLTADIAGGNDCGIDTIWLNRTNEPVPENIVPTYTVKTLSEIKKII